MSDIKRQKYYERDYFTYDEKMDIARKSDDRCCHCGKKVFFGYGATVDHFIPLFKGGCNRMFNLVMMCKTCNDNKEDKVYDISYVPYLKEKYRQELEGYVESYIRTVDFISRNRLLAYDRYDIPNVSALPKDKFRSRNFRKANMRLTQMTGKSVMKKADYDDFDRIYEFYNKYLTKFGSNGGPDRITANIMFWLRFGCIYYVEKNGDIAIMCAVTRKHFTDNIEWCDTDYGINILVFPYYSTETTTLLAINMVNSIVGSILSEQNLKRLPVRLRMLSEDKSSVGFMSNYVKSYTTGDMDVFGCRLIHVVEGDIDDHSTADMPDADKDRLKSFFEKFEDLEKEIVNYFKTEEEAECNKWLVYDVLSINDIKRTGVDECFEPEFKDYNDGLVSSAIRSAARALTRNEFRKNA